MKHHHLIGLVIVFLALAAGILVYSSAQRNAGFLGSAGSDSSSDAFPGEVSAPSMSPSSGGVQVVPEDESSGASPDAEIPVVPDDNQADGDSQATPPEEILPDVPSDNESLSPLPVEFTQPTGTVVTITNLGFEPADVTVSPGTMVTWVNEDIGAHQIHHLGAPRAFQGDRISPGESYSFTFAEAGTYRYGDTILTYMQGHVIVEGEQQGITGNVVLLSSAAPGISGLFTLAVLFFIGSLCYLIVHGTVRRSG